MNTNHDWLQKWALYSPNKIAFEEYESHRTLTFKQINNLANYLSKILISELNLKKGDRIALLAENQLEYIVLFSVAQKTGIILVPLNYRLAKTEINYLLQQSEASIIYYQKEYLKKIPDKFKKISKNIEELTQITNSKQKNKTTNFENINFDENQPIFLIFTSGTTAFPKAAIYTHKMLHWNALNTLLRLDINSNDRALNCAPLFHTGGWNVLLSPFILHGAYTLLMRNFDAENVLEILHKENHTIFWGVPTMLKMMQNSKKYKDTDFSTIRYFVVGGEAMPVLDIQKWKQKNVSIRQGYGLTEVGPNVSSLNQEFAISKQGSIGFPNFFYQIKIINEKGETLKTGQKGELLIKAPTVTPGYWNNPEATKKSITDGWFHTGDIVYQDNEGFLYIVDRIKNMYISGGENVYPAEVEHVLQQHESIEQVAIIGIPDDKWGECGKAFIKRTNNISEKEILTYCEQRLAKFKIPKQIKFIENLPLNDSGKIDRKKLKTL